MNPGVSLLMLLKREMSWKKMLCYWAAQLLGAIVASSLVWGSTSGLAGEDKLTGEVYNRPPLLLGATTLDPLITVGNGFLIELMGSFFFYFVIAQTALDKKGIATTAFPAIPIGLSLVVVHICLIPVSHSSVVDRLVLVSVATLFSRFFPLFDVSLVLVYWMWSESCSYLRSIHGCVHVVHRRLQRSRRIVVLDLLDWSLCRRLARC